MEPLPRRPLRERRFRWDRKFTSRQEKRYRSEDFQIPQQPGQSAVTVFLNDGKLPLDPPQYNCTALESFLTGANELDLMRFPSGQQQKYGIALIDERSDITGWESVGEHHGARDWDGYSQYPPAGANASLNICNAAGLYQRLLASRVRPKAVERRIIYTAGITPLCALAIASTVPRLQAPILRNFLERYVASHVFFGVSISFYGFAMEFHFPYYALRESTSSLGDSRGLRRSNQFLGKALGPRGNEYLCEAQISVLVTGIDEWFWTAYCCVDTYFGSEENVQYYHDEGLDAPSGGEKFARYPIWNPRGYFLYILSRRFRQATKEWTIVVRALENRLKFQESSVFQTTGPTPLFDDIEFSRTRGYTATIDLLRLQHNAIIQVIESWERFENGELQYFLGNEHDTLHQIWDGHLADVEMSSNELRSLRTILRQKIETFDNMRNGLVNASAMKESRVATEQGKNISRLTRVTVAYLPLGLGTAAFSMAILPGDASWVSYVLLLTVLTILTLAIAFRSQEIKDFARFTWQKTTSTLLSMRM